MQAATSTVEVVELALRFMDLTAPSLPVGGGLALAGAARPYAEAVVAALTRYPKEHRMTNPDDPAAPPAPVTLPSLAEQNAAAIRDVEARIAALVDQRHRINAEVGQLRGALVALQAANRHYVKLGAQLALPLVSGSAPLDEAPETGSDDDGPAEWTCPDPDCSEPTGQPHAHSRVK